MLVPLVLDFGTSSTKMGLAVQNTPTVIPSTIVSTYAGQDAEPERGLTTSSCRQAECRRQVLIGDEAVKHLSSAVYSPSSQSGGVDALSNSLGACCPFDGGRVANWDAAEEFLYKCFTGTLELSTDQHAVLLCESPIVEPNQVESIAEVFFEVFGFPRLEIAPQELLAVYGFLTPPPLGAALHRDRRPQLNSSTSSTAPFTRCQRSALSKENIFHQMTDSHAMPSRFTGVVPAPLDDPSQFTGVVINVGDGVSRVAAVADGFLLKECVKELPLAGKHVATALAALLTPTLRTHGYSTIPVCSTVHGMEMWRSAKESLARVSDKLAEEYFFDTFGSDASMPQPELSSASSAGGQTLTVRNLLDDLRNGKLKFSLENSLASECLFHPKVLQRLGLKARAKKSLPETVDAVIQKSPIDSRRKMYENIYLIGGGSMLRNFPERLECEIRETVNERLADVAAQNRQSPRPITVRVHHFKSAGPHGQTSATTVWHGGARYALMQGATHLGHSRDEYLECGARLFHAKSHLSRLNGWGLGV